VLAISSGSVFNFDMNRLLILLLGLVTVPTFAGTLERLDFLGFSDRGVYAAFETYGIRDGSGLPYSEVSVVNVEKNVFAPGTPLLVEGKKEGSSEQQANQLLEDVRKLALKKSKTHFKSFKFGADRRGTQVAFHPRTDLGVDSARARFTTSEELSLPGDEFVVALKQTDTEAAQCAAGEKKAGLLELTLENVRQKKTITLQKDTAVPKSRGCARDYRVYAVHVDASGAIAVFIEYQVPGFEGPDRKFLCVTGHLPS
jgi:predicted secreted protein